MEAVVGDSVAAAGQEVCSWVEARDTLRQWREEDPRKSSRTVQLGRYLLTEKKS